MEKKKRILACLALLSAIGAVCAHYLWDPWGYYWKVSPEEAHLRSGLIQAAEQYLGFQEADNSHKPIIDQYNTLEPLPVGYTVQYADSWCAVFATVAAMDQGLTDIIPPECGCQRQIDLWKAMGRWEENDRAIPAPGDLIYYDWDQTRPGDCTGWADHVGIVVGIKWPFLKTIEGNYQDKVAYRIIPLWNITIRGYGKPDYASRLMDSNF